MIFSSSSDLSLESQPLSVLLFYLSMKD